MAPVADFRLLVLRVVGRLPETVGCVAWPRPAGVGQASGEETAGGFRLGGGACSVYGDLTAAGWLSGVAGSAGSRGSGQLRHRRDGLAATLRWRSRALLAALGAWGSIGQSGTVAGGKGRHPSCLLKG